MTLSGEQAETPAPKSSGSQFAPIATTFSSDLDTALSACEFPLVVWATPNATIVLANQAAADLVGVPLEALIGRSTFDLRLPRSSAELAVRAITSDQVENLRSRAEIVRADGGTVPVWTWTRAIELDAERGGVTLITPVSDIARLGRDVVAPWRDLNPIAVGVIDRAWRIESVSADIRELTGQAAAEVTGRRLLDLVHAADRTQLSANGPEPPSMAVSWCHARLASRDGWTEGCILLSPLPPDGQRFSFALVGRPRPPAPPSDRVAELEHRLRRIAAEVRAAGVLESVGDLASPSNISELGELSSRQWEIVSRLQKGQRVAAIAEALFVSPSTVRNHLSTIFRKFGVHSQSDLLERLRQPDRSGRD